MEKRQLNEYEKKTSIKNLITLEEELEYTEKIDIAKKQHAIDTAEIIVKKQLRDLNSDLKVLNNEADILRNTIIILKDQVENGVEIKENNTEKEVTQDE